MGKRKCEMHKGHRNYYTWNVNSGHRKLPGEFIPITWFSTLPLLSPDDVVRYIYHVIRVGTMFMIHKMHDDYYWASIYEIHKTHATHY